MHPKPEGSGDSMIPKWMKADFEPCQCGLISGGRKSFIQNTLDSFLAFWQALLSLVMVFNMIS